MTVVLSKGTSDIVIQRNLVQASSLCSKYVKNCNIFGQILNIWVKLILKKKIQFFFQCLALPKDPQSFGILIRVLQAYVVNMSKIATFLGRF